jgi:hypothetical protein
VLATFSNSTFSAYPSVITNVIIVIIITNGIIIVIVIVVIIVVVVVIERICSRQSP